MNKHWSDIFHRDGVHQEEDDAIIALTKVAELYEKEAKDLNKQVKKSGPYFMDGNAGLYIWEYYKRARLYRDVINELVTKSYK